RPVAHRAADHDRAAGLPEAGRHLRPRRRAPTGRGPIHPGPAAEHPAAEETPGQADGRPFAAKRTERARPGGRLRSLDRDAAPAPPPPAARADTPTAAPRPCVPSPPRHLVAIGLFPTTRGRARTVWARGLARRVTGLSGPVTREERPGVLECGGRPRPLCARP